MLTGFVREERVSDLEGSLIMGGLGWYHGTQSDQARRRISWTRTGAMPRPLATSQSSESDTLGIKAASMGLQSPRHQGQLISHIESRDRDTGKRSISD